MNKFCVGIDISKLNFSVALKIKEKEKVKTFINNEKGFKGFLELLQKNSANYYHSCMESTGKYGNALAEFLHDNGHIVSILNPAKIKFFMQSQLSRNKTDAKDACHILHYCELFNPPAWTPTPVERGELQELTKRLDTLIAMKTEEQNRLENAAEIVKESITEHVEYLKKEIKILEKKIKSHIENNTHFKEQEILLSSIKGIGDKTISKIIGFIGNVEAFAKAKTLASYIGLTPRQFQSGTSLNHSHLSKMGNAELRKMFYMPALVAIRHNPVIKRFYERLLSNGKTKKVAICAAMRKLVHIVYGVLKSKTAFDPAAA